MTIIFTIFLQRTGVQGSNKRNLYKLLKFVLNDKQSPMSIVVLNNHDLVVIYVIMLINEWSEGYHIKKLIINDKKITLKNYKINFLIMKVSCCWHFSN